MSGENGSGWNNRGNSWFRGNSWTQRGGQRGGFGRGNRRPWRGGPKNFGSGPPHGNFSQRGYGDGMQGNYNSRGGGYQPWKNQPRRETPGKRLSEKEIGVTEYVSDHNGFQGIIKSRYSDFQVSEINEKGEVAKLTDLSPPEPPAEEAVDEDEDLLLCKYNLEILPMETWDQINKLAVCAEPSDEKVEIDVTGMSKEERTKIHDAAKKAFGDSIVGSTVTEQEKKFVRFQKFRKGVRVDTRVKWAWPGEYVYFIVHKENCDTMDAAVRIAERLRINLKPSFLGYAGTKDRRAKTSQWFSVRRVDPRRLAAAAKHIRDLRIGNYSFAAQPLKLGMLKGNKFRIALRNVTADEAAVEAACRLLKDNGFINYYGLQRFGSRYDTPTYEIGLKLLQGNFKEAIDSILEQREGPLSHALQLYHSAGPAAALRAWPRRAPAAGSELRLLRALQRDPRDLLGALQRVARNTSLLYLHSFQSLVWNRCVSERLRRAGLRPAAGDLVLQAQAELLEELTEEFGGEEMESDEDSDTESEAKQDGGDKMADGGDKMAATEAVNVKPDTPAQEVKQKIPVKVLTQEDVDSGKYTILDIIMPLPGSMVEYPPNMVDYYDELLKKEGLNMTMKHKYKSYSMSGAYRAVCVRPRAVAWRSARYSDPYADLLLSDWDELEGRPLDGVVPDGKYKALLLEMTLPASCYATMALRELLRVDTSSDHQAQQNNYHEDHPRKRDGDTPAAAPESETDEAKKPKQDDE